MVEWSKDQKEESHEHRVHVGTNINQTMKLLCKVLSSKKLYNLNGKVKCTETYFNNNLIFLLSLI